MTLPYGRNTHEVEKRIRHEALNQTARKACGTLAMQHIQVSQSSLIRALRLMGSVNPEVRTSGYVGMDDFAKLKGHVCHCGPPHTASTGRIRLTIRAGNHRLAEGTPGD